MLHCCRVLDAPTSRYRSRVSQHRTHLRRRRQANPSVHGSGSRIGYWRDPKEGPEAGWACPFHYLPDCFDPEERRFSGPGQPLRHFTGVVIADAMECYGTNFSPFTSFTIFFHRSTVKQITNLRFVIDTCRTSQKFPSVDFRKAFDSDCRHSLPWILS